MFSTMPMSDKIQLLEGASYILALLSAPVAVIVYIFNVFAERARRRREIYDGVSNTYRRFLELTLQYPNVGATQAEPDIGRNELSEDERATQGQLFEFLMGVLEEAYLVYRDASSKQRRQQWAGWEAFIDGYCQRKSFREWRKENAVPVSQYDSDFELYLDQRIASAEARSAA
jgi:hypothetical protein